jgi:hypothetical protein
MEAIAEVVAETGILKGKRRRAVDSTVLDDAVARQDTVTQSIAGIRRFGREVPGGKELLNAHASGYDYTRTGKPDIAWDDQDAKDGLISALVTDAMALLAAVDPETLEDKAADAYDSHPGTYNRGWTFRRRYAGSIITAALQLPIGTHRSVGKTIKIRCPKFPQQPNRASSAVETSPERSIRS